MRDKQAAIRHLRRAVYLGPPCSEEVNLDARTVNRLLSGGAPSPFAAMRGPSPITLLLRPGPGLIALFLAGIASQMGLGREIRDIILALSGSERLMELLEPHLGAIQQHALSLAAALRGENWAAASSEMQALAAIFEQAAGRGNRDEEAFLRALARGLRAGSGYIARGETAAAGRAVWGAVEPFLKRLLRKARRRGKGPLFVWARAGGIKERMGQFLELQQILNLPPVSPMVTYSPTGVRIRE